jgi:glutaredoxin 3
MPGAAFPIPIAPFQRKAMSTMKKVLMYSTAVCPYCVRAEALLKQRGVGEIEKIRIDLDPLQRDAMMERTGRRTVPQIYIGDTHVGGYDDLAALDRADKLVPMLG